MKNKLLIGFFVLLVSTLMLMSNVLGSGGPPIWLNQATLSNVDPNPSQDPEISGFGLTQVAVWEEWNENNWDINMRYSLNDGAPGSWVFPVVHPATSPADETNPAVTVTINPFNGATEIHVVYQEWDSMLAQWDVYHTWTNNFGVTWWNPFRLDVFPPSDAIDPAIVYSEDLSNPGFPGMLVQFTWAELNLVSGFYEIQYDAYYYDPTIPPPGRGYVGPTLIRASPGGHCEKPEIASFDDRVMGGLWNYFFGIVWQEPGVVAPININIWYINGMTIISPPPSITILTPGSLGQINPVFVPPIGDCYDPDIAATQDYQVPETYYIHVDWVFNVWAVPPAPATWQIDTCYAVGAVPTLGAAALAAGLTVPARGPGIIVLDRPTIASKVIGLPANFQTWMCWEDNSMPGSNPEIYYAVGLYTGGMPPFAFVAGPARVTYLPLVGSNNFNPELWNRDDSTRLIPPLTHLVFDQTIAITPEIEYIDP